MPSIFLPKNKNWKKYTKELDGFPEDGEILRLFGNHHTYKNVFYRRMREDNLG
jgi:hypothetical protein